LFIACWVIFFLLTSRHFHFREICCPRERMSTSAALSGSMN